MKGIMVKGMELRAASGPTWDTEGRREAVGILGKDVSPIKSFKKIR